MAVHEIETGYAIQNDEEKHFLVIDALHGSTHNSSFKNVEGDLVIMNNNNNRGFLGKGKDLRGKIIKVNTNAENNTPSVNNNEVRITIEYYIEASSERTKIAEYDRPKEEDEYPTIKPNITFE